MDAINPVSDTDYDDEEFPTLSQITGAVARNEDGSREDPVELN
jgi:hypothetical protein